jgi:hypothetical protein
MEEVSLSRSQIEVILRSRLESATERYRAACEVSTAASVNAPESTATGTSALNGALRIQSPDMAESIVALAELEESLTRFSGFILHGVVPDDLIDCPSEESETLSG